MYIRHLLNRLMLIANLSLHRVKSVRIRSYSGPHFPAFVLDTERYGVSPVFSLNAGKCEPELLRMRALFMQCYLIT